MGLEDGDDPAVGVGLPGAGDRRGELRGVVAVVVDDGDAADRAEPLENTINLADVFGEALSLALPPYPRAEGANLSEAVFTEDGKTPLTDQDTKPFAGLAALKARLQDKEG